MNSIDHPLFQDSIIEQAQETDAFFYYVILIKLKQGFIPKIDKIEKKIAKLPEVGLVSMIAGKQDIVIVGRSRNPQEAGELVVKKLMGNGTLRIAELVALPGLSDPIIQNWMLGKESSQ